VGKEEACDAVEVAECRASLGLVDGEEACASCDDDRAHTEERADVARDD
jgi:hypothetical protein